MKTFVLILMGLGVMILLASCGLIRTSSVDKKFEKIADEYGGVYVFDKKFRDEIIQREKERKEYDDNHFKEIRKERERILRTLFTEEEIQAIRDKKERDRKGGSFYTYYDPVTKKEEELWWDLNKKYPDLVEEKFPRILSNGCKYFVEEMSKELEETDLTPYYQKIKEYMGEEVFEKLKGGLSVTSYYVDKNNKVIPISIYTYIYDTITTYGLYGDEGSRIRFSDSYSVGIAGGNFFYLVEDKFIKSNEKRQGKRH